jgi:hypothetical protein
VSLLAAGLGLMGAATTGGDPTPETPKTPPANGQEEDAAPGETEAAKLSRRERAQAAAIEALVKELGFEKLDALKTFVVTARSQEEKGKTAQQKFQERIEALEIENSTAKAEALRARIAARYGLPEELAKRLVGKDEVELEADAKKLAELVKKPADGKAQPNPSPGNPASPGGKLTREEIKNMTPEEALRRWKEVEAFLKGD